MDGGRSSRRTSGTQWCECSLLHISGAMLIVVGVSGPATPGRNFSFSSSDRVAFGRSASASRRDRGRRWRLNHREDATDSHSFLSARVRVRQGEQTLPERPHTKPDVLAAADDFFPPTNEVHKRLNCRLLFQTAEWFCHSFRSTE
jgi:hypothetical protein